MKFPLIYYNVLILDLSGYDCETLIFNASVMKLYIETVTLKKRPVSSLNLFMFKL